MERCIRALVAGLLMAVMSPGMAQQPSLQNATIEVVTPASDDDNYISDRLSFPVSIWVYRVDLKLPSEPIDQVCAPAGTQLRGFGVSNLKLDEDATPKRTTMFLVEKVGKDLKPIGHVKNLFMDVNDPSAPCPGGTNTNELQRGDVLLLRQDRIESLNPVRKGLTYGALMVPYKYHRSGEKGFSSGASLGGYLGYRIDRTGFTGFETNFIGFVGGANIAVPETVDGVATMSNRAGVSYGIGILATVKDEFQIGLVIGRDRVDDAAEYVRNGRTWVALSLGYEFSN